MTSRRQRQREGIVGVCVPCGGKAEPLPDGSGCYRACARCRAFSVKSNKKLRQARKALGLCVDCAKPARPRPTDGLLGNYCGECAHRHSQYGKRPLRDKEDLEEFKRVQQQRHAAGLCVTCTAPAMIRCDGNPGWYCRLCLDRHHKTPDARDAALRSIRAKGGMGAITFGGWTG